MRKRLYGIFGAVFLCMWIVEKTDADLITNMKLVQVFYLYNDCDLLYNGFNVQATEEMWENAEAYAKDNPHPIVGSDYIMKQHIYLSGIRREIYGQYFDTVRAAIMFNFFLTLEAYSAAVSFRACAFYYKYVHHNWLKSSTCWNLSLYMEWYFSFMLEKKAEDLCTLNKFFIQKPNKAFKVENMCTLLKKLNLNFLKFPGDQTFIDLLQDDENNIYDSDKLTSQDPVTGEKRFISVFEKYRVPEKEESERPDVYYKKGFDEIWKVIKDAHTDKFSDLLRYLYEVIQKRPHPVGRKPMIGKIVSKQTWNKVFEFCGIMNLPTDAQRGVVYEGNTIGSVIYRSNAVEILRQISYYSFYPKLIKAGLQIHDIMTIVNYSNIKCPLIVAPDNLSVDYCLDIYQSIEIIPLLNH